MQILQQLHTIQQWSTLNLYQRKHHSDTLKKPKVNTLYNFLLKFKKLKTTNLLQSISIRFSFSEGSKFIEIMKKEIFNCIILTDKAKRVKTHFVEHLIRKGSSYTESNRENEVEEEEKGTCENPMRSAEVSETCVDDWILHLQMFERRHVHLDTGVESLINLPPVWSTR